MKTVLIISPYFPPSNAADMQRIRMSLPFFAEFGYNAEVVCVDEKYSDMVKDDLLSVSVPAGTVIHSVKAFSKKRTSKIGLGSIALRSLYFYNRKVKKLLRSKRYDLVYFSTTQFPVCILGNYWKKKYKVPYVIDMQDPWHSEYYQDKPKQERPPKYWFSYRLNKLLEPIAMRHVDGLIAVSTAYITTLKERYPSIKDVPAATITFGAFKSDFEILKKNKIASAIEKKKGRLALVYVGRGGHDMRESLQLLFSAFKRGLQEMPEVLKNFHFYFIGTSYAPQGKGEKTILPVAQSLGIEEYVSEQTDRVPFYQGLKTLTMADGFIIPGSNDAGYTASKLYPYILAQKPLLGIFHEKSSAVKILKECQAGEALTLQSDFNCFYLRCRQFFLGIYNNTLNIQTDWKSFEPYTAKEMCRRQVELFEAVLKQ
ncbi:MAG: glycosyltransferase [Ilyomonas sp.]